MDVEYGHYGTLWVSSKYSRAEDPPQELEKVDVSSTLSHVFEYLFGYYDSSTILQIADLLECSQGVFSDTGIVTKVKARADTSEGEGAGVGA